ncbi:MAG: hypothetical protein JNL67_02100 [Planctomycetaceae bacterium]|nr:hypothetical protein [Planctomycetaceae bacterium]
MTRIVVWTTELVEPLAAGVSGSIDRRKRASGSRASAANKEAKRVQQTVAQIGNNSN